MTRALPATPSAVSICSTVASSRTPPSGTEMYLLTKYPEEETETMPVLSKFYGIVIRMVFTRSFTAHFHAISGHCELIVGSSPLRGIQGDAPGRVRALVLKEAK